jgi:O-phospho-L-seryl-tRNASec:L-selenocysteinyl-tRNA synthase
VVVYEEEKHPNENVFQNVFHFLRVVVSGEEKNINENLFKNFGSHSNEYPHSYLTAASAIGIKKKDVNLFIKRLQKILSEKCATKETSE